MYLCFLEGLEEGWGDFVGLVVCDGVVGEVDVEESSGFVKFLGVFDVAKCWFN